MRKINLRLLASSVKPGVVGDGGEVAKSGDGRQKGGVRFAVARAPLDAWLGQKKEGIEAHLLGQTLASGVVYIGGYPEMCWWRHSVILEIETKREEIEATAVLYRVSEVCCRSATAVATAGRGSSHRGGELLRLQWRRQRRRRILVFIHAKGYVGWFGLRLGPGCWVAVQAATGLVRAVLVGCSMGCPTR
jgi:hypothetical protein